MGFQKWIFATLLAMIMGGCFFDEVSSKDSVVLLEDVIYVSGNRIRLLGRVYSSEGNIQDHGFYLSLTEDFQNASIRSLGKRNSLGLFVSEFDSLSQLTEYYYKAYIITNGNTVFSETGIVSTYESRLYGFSPTFGNPGDELVIEGSNLTTSIKVFIGGREAELKQVVSDFRLIVNIPANGTNPIEPITVLLDDKTYDIGTFEYIAGKWTKLYSFTGSSPAAKFYDPAFFQSDNMIYVGYGSTDEFSEIRQNFVSLDLETMTQSTFEPIGPAPVIGPFFTTSGFFGSGADSVIVDGFEFTYELNNKLWKFENGAFTTFNITTDFIFAGAAFDDPNNADGLYVFGGLNEGKGQKLSMFKLTPRPTSLGNMPFAFQNRYPHTTVNGQFWFLNSNEEFWSYDPVSSTFNNFGRFNENVGQYGKMQELNNYVYFGLFQANPRLWRMNPETLEIIEVSTFPGDSRALNAAMFTYNENLYVIRSPRISQPNAPAELWMLEPNKF